MNLETEILVKPYNDWDGIRALGTDLEPDDGLTLRYRALYGSGTENPYLIANTIWTKPVDVPDLKQTRFLTLTEARRAITAAFAQKVEQDFNRGGKFISSKTGIEISLPCKFLRSAADAQYIRDEMLPDGTLRYPHVSDDCRPFSIPLIQVQPVASFVMKSSVHEMFFGEPGKIVLSKYHSDIVYALSHMGKVQLDEIYNLACVLRDKSIERYRSNLSDNSVDMSPYGQIKPANKLIGQRIREAATSNMDIYGTRYLLNKTQGGPHHLKAALAKASSDENYKLEKKAFEPSIDFFMFIAFESQVAMDFYLSNDYIYIAGGFSSDARETPASRIYMRTGLNVKEVTNKRILQILSISVSLESEEKTVLDSEILRHEVQRYLSK